MKSERGMKALNELIRRLSEPELRRWDVEARASHTCKLCGEPAGCFRNSVCELEYRISAICQKCQDRYFQW